MKPGQINAFFFGAGIAAFFYYTHMVKYAERNEREIALLMQKHEQAISQIDKRLN